MQDHLKERLTGAAILVIVVVLLVPELLSGPPATNSRAGTGATAGPPVRSYTIDLRDPVTAQPPEAVAPPAAVASGPAESPVASAPSVNVPAPPVSAPPPTAAAAAPNAVAAAPPATTAPATSKSATPAPSAHAANSKGGWTVQIGSFARRDYAERMAKQVTAKGYSVEVAGPDDRGLFRVRSAPLADRAAAMALKQKMQASGLKPIVNTVP